MVKMDPLQMAEEEVMEESIPNKLWHIYTLLAKGTLPDSICPLKKKNLKRFSRKFIMEAGCLYYVGPNKEEKREVVIDLETKKAVFLQSHLTESGHHLGQKKTVNRIQSKYYWLGVVKDVVDWIKICEICQNAELHRSQLKNCKPIKADNPWQVLSMALHGPYPPSSLQNTYVLTVTDFFTQWTEAVPLPRNDARSVAKAMSTIYFRFGAAKHIYYKQCTIVDTRQVYYKQSCDFCEEVCRHLWERWHISQTISPGDNSDVTGLDNQIYEAINAFIRKAVNDYLEDWDDHLESILFQFRASVNAATNYTPFFLMFNRDMLLSSGDETIAKPALQGSTSQSKEDLYTAGVKKQRDAVKEAVLSNLSAASQPEIIPIQASTQTSISSPPTLIFEEQDELFISDSNPPLKKFKQEQMMSFKFETVLSPKQCTADEETS